MEMLTALLALGGVAWLWADSLRARERALRACRAACRDHDVQLLDQTVALASLRPARAEHGGLLLRRVYGFEFTATTMDRHPGWVILAGQRVTWVRLDGPGGPIWLPGGRRYREATGHS